jgi:hypothetical protein
MLEFSSDPSSPISLSVRMKYRDDNRQQLLVSLLSTTWQATFPSLEGGSREAEELAYLPL